MNPANAAMVAAIATASLMLLNRSLRRFHMNFETKLWFALAWALIIVTVMLVARALGL